MSMDTLVFRIIHIQVILPPSLYVTPESNRLYLGLTRLNKLVPTLTHDILVLHKNIDHIFVFGVS